jgi:hypothetical protein
MATGDRHLAKRLALEDGVAIICLPDPVLMRRGKAVGWSNQNAVKLQAVTGRLSIKGIIILYLFPIGQGGNNAKQT